MRKSISVAVFSLVSTLMVLGIVLMGASEWVLFKNYFAKDRYETLDQVVGVTQRTAQYLVQQAELPEGDELDALSTKLEIIGESAEAYLFFTDNDGRVMIASSPDKLESLTVPEEMMEKIDASVSLFSRAISSAPLEPTVVDIPLTSGCVDRTNHAYVALLTMIADTSSMATAPISLDLSPAL